jgi:O-antigen ligase
MKVVPVASLISFAAFMAAQQAVSPQRRAVKLGVFGLLVVLMMRFDMAYSVYLFTILFPFPSSISIGSTNSILMTIIPLIWAIRSSSTNTKFFLRKTKLDFPIVLFLGMYVVSLFNLDASSDLAGNLKVIWRTFAAVMYFYMIVMFVDSEKKIMLLMKVACVVSGFVMVTGIMELFFPGANVIPGWLSMKRQLGDGVLQSRIQGMRVGGVFQSQVMLADFGARMLVVMVYITLRTRNPFERMFWTFVSLLTIASLVATANRGAVMGLTIALIYGFWLFRHKLSPVRMLIIVSTMIVLFAGAEQVLVRYTYATSLTERLAGTYFKGAVPDTRKNTWGPNWEKTMRRPFFGHGPKFDHGTGLDATNWPHNGYMFYWNTIGLFGLLAFLFVVYRAWKESTIFRLPIAHGRSVADISRVLHLTLVIFLFQQIRTDHQRNDVYIYLVWLMFGLIVAAASTLRTEVSEERQKEGDAPGSGSEQHG